MGWVKERHSSDTGFRREDNLGYVGKSTKGFWLAYVRVSTDDDFQMLLRAGEPSPKDAQFAVDSWISDRADEAA